MLLVKPPKVFSLFSLTLIFVNVAKRKKNLTDASFSFFIRHKVVLSSVSFVFEQVFALDSWRAVLRWVVMASGDLRMPGNDQKTFDWRSFNNLSTYSNASFEIPGDIHEKAFVHREVDEEDLRKISVTQVKKN